MKSKISVIIPVYNVSEFLEKCIESCINQTFRDIEIIIVNDGSTDSSGLIIEKYAGSDERIVIISKENEGVFLSRLKGWNTAQGEYIFYLDGDDYLPEDALEKLYNIAQNDRLDYVIGGLCVVEGGRMKYQKLENTESLLSDDEFFYSLLQCGWNVCGRLIRRSLCNDFIVKPIAMGEDLYQNMQIVPNVKRAKEIQYCVYYYVRHAKSVTCSTDKNRSEFLNLQMMDSVLGLVNELDYDRKMKFTVYYIFRSNLLYFIKNRRQEIRPIIMNHIWSKREARSVIFHYGKLYYFLLAVYIHLPDFTCAALKVFDRLNLISIVRKYKLDKI